MRAAIPWLVLAAALLLTAVLAAALDRQRLASARTRFERRAEVVQVELRALLRQHELLLEACGAELAAMRPSGLARWPEFVGNLGLARRYPAIESLETIASGQSGSSPERLATMAIARRTGHAALSGPVTDTGGSGSVEIAMYEPVAHAADAKSADAVDFVVADLRLRDLLAEALDTPARGTLELRVYDSPRAEPAALLASVGAVAGREAPLFTRVVALAVPGRDWTLEMRSAPAFDAQLGERRWDLIGLALVASFAAFVLARSVVAAIERAHHLSMRDPLTGLFNRRYVEETIDREIARAHRAGLTVGVILLDIDHFKSLNDTHGHDAGDFVLARTGELLRHAARAGDIACRFGGEEFALILPGASLNVARERAEAIRSIFQFTPFMYEGERIEPLTLSGGVSALSPEDGDWAHTLQLADRALYTAKQAGRNRVLAVAAE